MSCTVTGTKIPFDAFTSFEIFRKFHIFLKYFKNFQFHEIFKNFEIFTSPVPNYSSVAFNIWYSENIYVAVRRCMIFKIDQKVRTWWKWTILHFCVAHSVTLSQAWLQNSSTMAFDICYSKNIYIADMCRCIIFKIDQKMTKWRLAKIQFSFQLCKGSLCCIFLKSYCSRLFYFGWGPVVSTITCLLFFSCIFP